MILGREFAQQMQTAYAKDIAASDVIEHKSWERRSLLLWLKDWTARLWGRLLWSSLIRSLTSLPVRHGTTGAVLHLEAFYTKERKQ